MYLHTLSRSDFDMENAEQHGVLRLGLAEVAEPYYLHLHRAGYARGGGVPRLSSTTVISGGMPILPG